MPRIRQRPGPETNLISEQRFRNLQQPLVDLQKQAAPKPRTNCQRKRRRHTARLENFVASLLEKSAKRLEGKQAPVPQTQNSLPAVIELTEREHESRHEESDVR